MINIDKNIIQKIIILALSIKIIFIANINAFAYIDLSLRQSQFIAYTISAIAYANANNSARDKNSDIVTIRVFGLPELNSPHIKSKLAKAIIDEFYRHYPNIRVKPATGLVIEGKGLDMVSLMQIAANIAPDVLYVNFRRSDTYISQGFLYPLDEYVKKLSTEELKVIPDKLWPVIKRNGPPDGKKHIYAWPTQPLIRAVLYRRDLFQAAGLPDRAPRNWDELMKFARKLTDPEKGTYGLFIYMDEEMAWEWLMYLWSAGGDAIVKDKNGQWRCVFDSDAAAESALFFTKLIRQKWKKKYIRNGKVIVKEIEGVVYRDVDPLKDWNMGRIGMRCEYIGFDNMINIGNPDLVGIGPPPAGPTGKRGTELNARMMGIYAGIKDPKVRQAAWNYIHFWMSKDARRVMVDTLVKNGYARFAQPEMLKEFGYTEYARLIPKSWQNAFKEAVKFGKPEPYGKNCQLIYRWMTKPLGQILYDKEIIDAINRGDDDFALKKIKKILHKGVEQANEKMIGIIPPKVKRFRNRVAFVVIIIIATVFTLVFRDIWRVFSPPKDELINSKTGNWQFRKYKIAYLCLLPAIITIALWQYYPLLRGILMAFEDYHVTGGGKFVGLENFADVLFDDEFWYSMWVAIKYSLIYMTFGFTAPIILAILLQEVPKGKILYRTIYYLPAVITGLVVIFLWKTFYKPTGLLNQILNFIGITSNRAWLQDPKTALICCIIPVIWAGMGPGCLIYLAALKTVPDDLYEAANIDGAGIWKKIIHITLPSIKALIIINFVGAFIASFQSANFILAMTGGGPYTPYGATEVAGLHIFYTAFFYLKFGIATAMAWILGLMLIGFTLIQLRRLRNMEFRTAGQE